jgi:hypothetical protein
MAQQGIPSFARKEVQRKFIFKYQELRETYDFW